MKFEFDKVFCQMMEKCQLDTVILLGHINPDGDASGSVMGTAHYIHAVYPQYQVYPYLEDTLDKGPKKMVTKDLLFDPFMLPTEERYAVIVCDTAILKRLAGREIYENAEASIVIDHHASNEGYGDVNYTRVSEACAENVYEILNWNSWKNAVNEERQLHPNAADYVYMGILHDTGSFARAGEATFQAAAELLKLGVDHNYVMQTMHNDTVYDLQKRGYLFSKVQRAVDNQTFQAAAELLKLGVDHNYVMQTMHNDTVYDLQKRGYLFSKVQRAVDNQSAFVIVNREMIEQKGISYEDIHSVSESLRDCEDVKLGFTMYEEEPGRFRCSFRSDGKWINVNELLAPFGGGGHAGSAGVRKRTDDPDEFLEMILQRVEEIKMIRKMELRDLDAVMKIWLDSNEQVHDFVPEEYWKNHFEEVRSILPEAEVYVYESEGKILGFAGMMEDYIAGIFVAEKFRSKGIGKILMKYMKEKKVYVYESEGKILGFAGMMEDYIAGIFVAEKFRSKGIGKILMKYMKEKKQKLRLSVYEKNQAAVRFYQRENFQIRTEGVDDAVGEAEYEMIWER